MSRRCELGFCGKKPMTVTRRKLLRGNYNPTSKTRQKVNTQFRTLANGIRVRICTTCARTLNKSQINV